MRPQGGFLKPVSHTPCYGFTGDYGHGKTSTAIRKVWEQHQKTGLPVWSNLSRLIDYRVYFNPFMYDGWMRRWGMWLPVNARTFGEHWQEGVISSLNDFASMYKCILLLDEIEAWWSAKGHSGVSEEVMRNFNQQRKRGVHIRWTAPSSGMVFNQVRDMTQYVWHCKKVGRYSMQTQINMRVSKKDEARNGVTRWVKIDPAYYNLYCSWEVIGDDKGEGYMVGEDYPGLTLAQVTVGRRKFGPSFGWDGKGTGLESVELYDFDGSGGRYQTAGGVWLPWRTTWQQIRAEGPQAKY